MIRNESSTPYLMAIAMTVGLGVLIYGVELGAGEHPSALAEPLQAAGGVVIVLGILGLAWYIERLPGGDADH